MSDHHKDRFANGFIAAVFVAVSCLLLVRLGHYALWDDETMVALVAKGVMRTGDTVAKIDQNNIVAYRSGLLLHHGADRSTPPLSTYLTAASFMLFGVNTWAARLPFAFFGLATSVLLLRWAKKERLPTLALFIMGLLGTTSFFLYFRQCRYFAPAIFFPWRSFMFIGANSPPSPRC